VQEQQRLAAAGAPDVQFAAAHVDGRWVHIGKLIGGRRWVKRGSRYGALSHKGLRRSRK
jgi:hypothetical protein